MPTASYEIDTGARLPALPVHIQTNLPQTRQSRPLCQIPRHPPGSLEANSALFVIGVLAPRGLRPQCACYACEPARVKIIFFLPVKIVGWTKSTEWPRSFAAMTLHKATRGRCARLEEIIPYQITAQPDPEHARHAATQHTINRRVLQAKHQEKTATDDERARKQKKENAPHEHVPPRLIKQTSSN